MELFSKLTQCKKDIENLKGAINATRNRAADIITEVLKEKGDIAVKPESNLLVIVSGEAHLDPFTPKKMIQVSRITLSRTRDYVTLTGLDEDKGKEATVSVEEIDNPEKILAFLEKMFA